MYFHHRFFVPQYPSLGISGWVAMFGAYVIFFHHVSPPHDFHRDYFTRTKPASREPFTLCNFLFVFYFFQIRQILQIFFCHHLMTTLFHKFIIWFAFIIYWKHNAGMCHSIRIKFIQIAKFTFLH